MDPVCVRVLGVAMMGVVDGIFEEEVDEVCHVIPDDGTECTKDWASVSGRDETEESMVGSSCLTGHYVCATLIGSDGGCDAAVLLDVSGSESLCTAVEAKYCRGVAGVFVTCLPTGGSRVVDCGSHASMGGPICEVCHEVDCLNALARSSDSDGPACSHAELHEKVDEGICVSSLSACTRRLVQGSLYYYCPFRRLIR